MNTSFEEYKKNLLNNQNSTEYFENKTSWLSSCIDANQGIKNLLREQYEQFKSNQNKGSNPKINLGGTEKISDQKKTGDIDTCGLF